MTQIRDIMQRPVDQSIAEVIQVTEHADEAVYEEISEYVVTRGISDAYREVLDAIASAPSVLADSVGIWVSGFFGSGKSSFAKNLGYVLMNPAVRGTPASDLFKSRVTDGRVKDLIDSINARIPTESIQFDVQKERSLVTGNESIALILYSVLLRHLGYAEDIDIAELEIELEGKGELARFEELCQEIHRQSWQRQRRAAQKLNYASAVLHQMEPTTYPEADTWARSLAGHRLAENLTVKGVVSRAFELMERRRPGKAMAFVLDEVGAYVAASVPRLEDLRALVEEFGRLGREKLRAKTIPGPAWLIITSQEKLDEVVSALDARRVELARVQDRFQHRIDLAPADIREVATRRVLSKTPQGEAELAALYNENKGRLNQAFRLENSALKTDVSEEDFIQFFPYLPHYIDLSIDIMSGLRLAQAGAARHLGGSNRTIIKQAHEMLVNERTDFASKDVGALVSLDKVYELVEGNFATELRNDISEIERNLGDWPTRVAKAIALLSLVPMVPRTPANVAAFLIDQVGSLPRMTEVTDAIEALKNGRYIRDTDQGWKLQTAQEKGWDDERRGYLEPRPRDRNDIKREALGEIFEHPSLRTYQFHGVKTFRVGIKVDDVAVGTAGELIFSLLTADDASEVPAKIDEARERSRPPKEELLWIVAMTPELDNLTGELHASRRMISTYTQRRAQQQLTNNQAELLANEQREEQRLRERLRDKVRSALEAGSCVFQGVVDDASGLGSNLSEMVRHKLDAAIPVLYPKLEIGARQVKGTEPDEVLRAANLNALSAVFYGGPQGLGLISAEADRYVPNLEAPIAKEVLDYLRREHSFGNKVTGRTIEQHFGSTGYGWELDVLRIPLAVLLRAGAVEVTHQGRRYRGHQDPQARVPFTSTPAFRAASYAPRESAPTLRDLTRAVEQYEKLTGEEVDVEEAAIATALKRFAAGEAESLIPLEATAQARGWDGFIALLGEFHQTLDAIQQADTDDCVRILAGEGNSLRENRDRARDVARALEPANLEILSRARIARDQEWPILRTHDPDEQVSSAVELLTDLLNAEDLYLQFQTVSTHLDVVEDHYRRLYSDIHARRQELAVIAVDEVRAQQAWTLLEPDIQDSILLPLTSRSDAIELAEGTPSCRTCAATIPQMESDMEAIPALLAAAIARAQKAVAPPDRRVEQVKVAAFFTGALDDEQTFNEATERLWSYILKLHDEGAWVMLE